jgi:hypothetical protein
VYSLGVMMPCSMMPRWAGSTRSPFLVTTNPTNVILSPSWLKKMQGWELVMERWRISL